MKKAFRLKLLELCKTRAKKSSPDMFNIYVDLPGHDIILDLSKKPSGTQGPWKRQLNKAFVNNKY